MKDRTIWSLRPVAALIAVLFAITASMYLTNVPVNQDFESPDAVTGSVGNYTLNHTVSLESDVYAGNVTIEGGVTVYSNGYNFYVSGNFSNYGTIVTGAVPYGNFPGSYGGSGGGSAGAGADLVNGYSTLALGGSSFPSPKSNGSNGTSVSMPLLNASILQEWYNSGMQSHLAGAAGAPADALSGGSGAYGIYIQANHILAGSIESKGLIGVNSLTYGGIGFGFNLASGGGGGGTIILAYGNGGYQPGSFSVSGAYGGANIGYIDTVYNGGHGGNGNFQAFNYSDTPPINIQDHDSMLVYPQPISVFSGENLQYSVNSGGTEIIKIQSLDTTEYRANIYVSVNAAMFGGSGKEEFNLLGYPVLPILTAFDLHLLKLGEVPSNALVGNGTVVKNAAVMTIWGMKPAYEIFSPSGTWAFSKSNGVLLSADMHFSGSHLTYNLVSSNIPTYPFGFFPVSLIATVGLIGITATVAFFATSRLTKEQESVVRLRKEREGKRDSIVESLAARGLITEEEGHERSE